jgi:uncharacterized protein (DUF1501 family)
LRTPPITRRTFVGGAAALGGTTLAGCSAGPRTTDAAVTSTTPAAPGRDQGEPPGDGILVLVNLDGGNDGLNTVCPVEDGRYRAARGALALAPDAVHTLSEGFALHPVLAGCKELWDQERLAVIHGVGFADLDRSHFHCRDVWQAGDSSSTTSGWVGRWLDGGGADVLRAVAVDRLLPLVLRGDVRSGAVVPPGRFGLPDEAQLRPLLDEMSRPDPSRAAVAAAVAASNADLLDLTAVVAPVLEGATVDDAVGSGDGLVGKLDTVATLIDADLGTRVYTVQLGGFDTHAGQAAVHAGLLGELDRALTGFLAKVAGRAVTHRAHHRRALRVRRAARRRPRVRPQHHRHGGAGRRARRRGVADELGGRVRIMGTPAEEGGGGKVLMAPGAFDGVDAAMMVHPADADLIAHGLPSPSRSCTSRTTARRRTPPPRPRRAATRSTPPCSAT